DRLENATADEEQRGARHTTREGAQCEHQQALKEDASPSCTVGNSSRGNQQGGINRSVGIQDPGEVCRCHSRKPPPESWKCDEHDRGIQKCHEDSEAGPPQRAPCLFWQWPRPWIHSQVRSLPSSI